jgi:hypothetical protein
MPLPYSNRSRSASSIIIAIIAIYIITSFSFSTVEAQNMTNQTAGRPSIDDIISVICASDATGEDNNNTSSNTNSTTQTAVDIRCLLREARNAIAEDATNEALQLIDAAENKLLSAFGDNNMSSSSSPSTGNVNIQ